MGIGITCLDCLIFYQTTTAASSRTPWRVSLHGAGNFLRILTWIKLKKMCRMEVVNRQEIYARLRSSDTLNLKGSTYLTSNLTLVLCYKKKKKKVSENSNSSPEAAIKYWGCDLSLQWEHKFSTILAFFYISGKMDWHTLCTGFKFKSLFIFFHK